MRVLFILGFIFTSLCSSAQSNAQGTHQNKWWQRLSLQGTYQSGYVFETNDFLRGINSKGESINDVRAFSIKISRQTSGKNRWEQLYNYPGWGAGLYIANFDNRKEIGIPIALYGFFNAPFKQWNRLSLNYELGFGAAFNWSSFNPITNQYNISIGSKRSFFIDAGLSLHYHVNPNIDLIPGFSFNHFSNGALKKPNKGINTIAPTMSLKYNFFDPVDLYKQKIATYDDENEWLISIFGGAKNVVFDSVDVSVKEKYQGVYFPVFGVSTALNRQVSYKSKVGVGITVSYNGSVNAQIAVDGNELDTIDGRLADKIQLSIYPSYELLINRLSIIFQPAFYLFRKKQGSQSPVFHQRIGLKYHVTKSFFVGITLRDYNFHVSDFIEWNMGYRIKWK